MNVPIIKRLRTIVYVSCMALALSLFAPGLLYATPKSQIFVLHSYSQEYSWTHGQHMGFIQTLAADGQLEPIVSTEYLDTKRRVYDETYASEMSRHLRLKYADYKPAAIYVTDDNALLFARDHLSHVFPGVPVFFSGVNDYSVQSSLDPTLFTGVFELKEFVPNVEWLLDIDKDANDIAFVGDGSNTYRAIEKDLRSELILYRLRVTFIAEKRLDRVLAQLRGLPGKYLFLTTLGGMTDENGQVLPLRDILRSLAHTGRIVISMEDAYIIEGVLGGHVTSGQKQGMNAARLLLAYLHGKPIIDLPPILKSPNALVFDDKVLQQHGIDLPESLRSKAILLHPRLGFYEQYRFWIFAILIVLAALLLSVVTASLVVFSRKNRELILARNSAESSNTLFNQLAEQSRTAQWEVNAEGLYTNVSDVSEAVIGYRPEELIGKKHFYDLHPAEDREAFKTKVFETFARKEPFHNLEDMMQTKDGRLIWVLTNGFPSLDGNGNLAGYRGSNSDITERKQAEEALRESEERYRMIFNNSPLGVMHFDANGIITDFNDKFAGIMGGTREKIIAFNMLEKLRDQAMLTAVKDALDGRLGYYEGDYVSITAGKTTPMRAIYQRITTADGKFLGAVGLFEDITARKRAEETLKESETSVRRRLQIILEPEGEIGSVTLSDIINKEDLQRLMDDLFRLTGAASAIVDTQGNVLTACGWQDICTRFHRVHPDTRQHCFESDTVLTLGTAPGEVKLYQCRNGMWDVVTPIHIGGSHIGNVFFGQFFFEDESPDSDRFRRQARQCGFDEEAYLAAFDRVPRWSREKVDQIMAFYARLAATISMHGYGNIRLARALTANERTLVALRESEALLSRSQEIVHLGSWQLDLTANRLTWSDEVYRIFNCEPQEFAATYEAFLDFVHPDDRAMLDEAYSRSLREDVDSYEIEHRIVRRNSGEVRHVHERCIHERDDAGAIVRSIGMVQDVTERKRVEEEREKLQSQLTQAQKMESIGQLAGGVAHDFNNMLNIILGYSQLALMKIEPSSPLNADLQEIMNAAKRSADLVHQLLAFARKQIIEPKILDLNDTVSSMLNMIRKLIGEQINLLWMPSANLWPVKMDSSQIDQILTNLAVNARDSISGVGKITIETGRAEFDEAYCAQYADFVAGQYVMLAVSDNGSGMDKETVHKIFEPFFTTKDVGKGTGMGLATVYGIVKQNNGFINVYSEPEKGTTFRIYLPRFEENKAASQDMATSSELLKGNETILVVEDEEVLLKLGKFMLEELGYNVVTASSPVDAIRLAGEHTDEIHLVMTDVIMPEMSGRDLQKRLSAVRPDMKYLFMSGYPANVIAQHGVLKEGVHFLQKPFLMDALATKVREALG